MICRLLCLVGLHTGNVHPNHECNVEGGKTRCHFHCSRCGKVKPL